MVFVTAGHIFTDIKTALDSGCMIRDWQINDSYALDQKRIIEVDGPPLPDTILLAMKMLSKVIITIKRIKLIMLSFILRLYATANCLRPTK